MDVADIGKTAAYVLADPASHRNAFYEMSGPVNAIYSGDEIADILTRVLGREIKHVAVDVEEHVKALPPALAEATR